MADEERLFLTKKEIEALQKNIDELDRVKAEIKKLEEEISELKKVEKDVEQKVLEAVEVANKLGKWIVDARDRLILISVYMQKKPVSYKDAWERALSKLNAKIQKILVDELEAMKAEAGEFRRVVISVKEKKGSLVDIIKSNWEKLKGFVSKFVSRIVNGFKRMLSGTREVDDAIEEMSDLVGRENTVTAGRRFVDMFVGKDVRIDEDELYQLGRIASMGNSEVEERVKREVIERLKSRRSSKELFFITKKCAVANGRLLIGATEEGLIKRLDSIGFSEREIENAVNCFVEKKAVSPPGWEETVEEMKKHPEIKNPFALAWWMHGEGYKPRKKKKSAVDTGDVVEEISEVIDETRKDVEETIDEEVVPAIEKYVQVGLEKAMSKLAVLLGEKEEKVIDTVMRFYEYVGS
uniref:Uncharacterized protein n=1 Tax=candidate division CPR3 bacterium TaxID=2268181 RepID=A0A7V3N4Q1_UNCC3